MRYRVPVLLLFLVLSPPLAPSVHLQTEGETGKAWGYTSYHIRFSTIGEGTSGNSRLKFPLDSWYISTRLKLLYNDEYQFILGVTQNLSNPSSLMTDEDWYLTGGERKDFAFTESPATLSSLEIYFQFKKKLYTDKNISFWILAGYSYQHITESIKGYAGWFLDNNGIRQPVEGDETALEYWIQYHTPFLGVSLPFHTGIIKTEAEVRFTLPLISDRDNHLLRNKQAETSGAGGGLVFILDLSRPLIKKKGFYPVGGIRGELNFSRADALQTQHWYGDEPETLENEYGKVIENIPNTLSLLNLRLGVYISLAYAE